MNKLYDCLLDPYHVYEVIESAMSPQEIQSRGRVCQGQKGRDDQRKMSSPSASGKR